MNKKERNKDEILMNVIEYDMVIKQYLLKPTKFNYGRTCYHNSKITTLTFPTNNSNLVLWGKRSLLLSLVLSAMIFLPAGIGFSKAYAIDQILTKGTGGKYTHSSFKNKLFDYLFVKKENKRSWKLTDNGQMVLSLITYTFALCVVIPILFPEGKIKNTVYFPPSLPIIKTVVETQVMELIKNTDQLICEPKIFPTLYDLLASEEVQVILKSSVKSLSEGGFFEILEKL